MLKSLHDVGEDIQIHILWTMWKGNVKSINRSYCRHRARIVLDKGIKCSTLNSFQVLAVHHAACVIELWDGTIYFECKLGNRSTTVAYSNFLAYLFLVDETALGIRGLPS